MRYYNYTRKDLLNYITELEFLNRSLSIQNSILKDLSSLNGLTKMNNEKTLVGFLSEELKADQPICIVIFYMDDTAHLYSNDMKERVAEIIKQHTRKTDLAGRFGDDEFVAILSNTNLLTAGIIAERLRKAVEATTDTGGVRIVLRASIKQYDSETLIDLIHFADLDLYKANAKGKNKLTYL